MVKKTKPFFKKLKIWLKWKLVKAKFKVGDNVKFQIYHRNEQNKYETKIKHGTIEEVIFQSVWAGERINIYYMISGHDLVVFEQDILRKYES